jgi:hypothetical protein
MPLDGDVVDTISIVCGTRVRGRYVPSFAHGPASEEELPIRSLPADRRTSTALNRLLAEVDNALQLTQRIKTQIIDAILGGGYPVIVSMGVNALSHNAERLGLFMQDFKSRYGPLDVWLRVLKGEVEGHRDGTSFAMYPTKVGRRYVGFCTSTDVGDCCSEGVEVWNDRLEEFCGRTKDIS